MAFVDKHITPVNDQNLELKVYFTEILEWGFQKTGLFDRLAGFEQLLPNFVIAYFATDVMINFMQTENLAFRTEENDTKEYAFEIIGYSNEVDSLSEKIRANKHCGDFCVFMAGFYPENLERRNLSPEVYEQLASTLYTHVYNFQYARDLTVNHLIAAICQNTSAIAQGLFTARDGSENFVNVMNDLYPLFSDRSH